MRRVRLPVGKDYGPDFRFYAAGQAVSLIGDRVALIALVFLVIHLSNAYAPALALFYVARVLPTLAGGLFAGYIADAMDRRQLLIACDLIRALLMAAVPALTAINLLSVYPIVVILYGLTVLFNTTARAMLPDIVPEDRILGANAIMTRIETLADLAYAAGGALIAAVKLSIPFYVDAATFAVSASAIAAIYIPSPRRAVAATLREVADRIREGIQFLMSQPFLKWSTISSLVAPLAIGGVFVVSPLFASQSLAHSSGLIGPLHSGAFRFSVLEVSIGLGGVVGSIVAPQLARPLPRGQVFAIGMTGFGLVVAVLSVVTNIYAALVVMALSGMCNSLFAIAGSTLVQTLTPSEMRGRVMAARITVIQGGLALGSALGGYLLVVMPVSRVWLVLAGLMLLASAMVWLPTGVRTQA
ncbi:MAG TPA: hypothetical protein DEV93_11770 [Chloroflexi bacterium]|jgi:MFS family permease|nr:hypothetical protein [Chloroflexota bacterium]